MPEQHEADVWAREERLCRALTGLQEDENRRSGESYAWTFTLHGPHPGAA